MEITLKILTLQDAKDAIEFLQTYVKHPVKVSQAEMSETIEDLDFTVRTTNCLKALEINSLAELVSWRASDLLKHPNLGRKSLGEIVLTLRERNLRLTD